MEPRRTATDNVPGDLESGLKPFCIVGSAGTVNTAQWL